jgi:excisionase family DNA binding protein
MTITLRERTLMPPEDRAELAEFARGLTAVVEPARARLIGPDGSQIEIPEDVYAALRDVVAALSEGIAISIAPHNTMLTTQEAADLLNISRPTLVRLLTDGEIAHTTRGRHRRVLLRDVLEYQERMRLERRQALDQMAADAEEDGLYEATAAPIRTSRPPTAPGFYRYNPLCGYRLNRVRTRL